MVKKLLGSLLMGMSIGAAVHAQPGSLDDSFNGKGIREISFHQNVSSDSVVATVLQPDGKLLVALVDNGGAGSGPTANAVVIRLKISGERDNTFGINGKVNVSLLVLANFHHNAMTLQQDGKIVLAGHRNNQGKSSSLCLVRLNADGSKDDTFGETLGLKKKGYLSISASQGYTFKTVKVLNSNGMILAAAATENGASGNFVFTATDQYGTVVSNYGGSTNGIISFEFGTPGPFAPNDDIIRASIVDQATGVWYIAGTTRISVSSSIQFAAISVDAVTGYYKTNFQFGGKVIMPWAPGTSHNHATSMCFTADNNSILIAGSPEYSPEQMMVYKLDKKLKIDSTFSSDGVEIYSIPNTTACSALSIVAETGNKVLLGGYASVSSGAVPAFIKINASTAQVETSFGNNGTKLFSGSTDGINALVYLPGLGKFIGAGNFTINADNDVIVERIEADGSTDNSYGTNAQVFCYAQDAATSIEDVLPRSDGKIWTCGMVANQYGAIALLNRDGSFDETFRNNLGDDPGVQYITNFLPLPPQNVNPLPNATAVAIEQTSDGKLLVAGIARSGFQGALQLYVLRLKNTNGVWIRDTDFGTNGYSAFAVGTGGNYLNDMLLQPDGKILLYSYVYYNSTYYAAVTRLTSNGAIDATGFATASPYPGTYLVPNTANSDPSSSLIKIKFVLQGDKKIVCSAPGTNIITGGAAFVAHRILEDGTSDASFNTNAGNALATFTNTESETVLLKKDGSIVLGGTQQGNTKNYALAQLKADGTFDTNFNNTGMLSFNKGYGVEVILQLNEQSDGSIVAAAVASIIDGHFLIMDIRVSATGVMDKSFYSEGLIPIAKGFPKASVILDGSLYIFGQRNAIDETAVGLMLKVKLGTGTAIKTTSLALANLTVQYGDKPFKLQPITNSPAKVFYSVVQSDCAKVDPLTGEIAVTCATVDSGVDVIVRAIQPATAGYTTDTAYSTIKVIKAVPRILFTNEGGQIGDTITVSAISSSGATPVFTQLDGTGYVQFLSANTAKLIAEGSSTVSVSFAATSNYEAATATALVSGYPQTIAPDANEDDAQLVFGTEVNISIDVLGNDEAFTGVIVPQLTDLDPSTPARDSVFVSPSLGLFEIDSVGMVTYTPFTGFIGAGDITYTIRDSKGVKSAPGIIHVAVVPQAAVPSLKATEMITPNNDGLNEAFVIGFVNLDKQNKLKVFDRNGEELFTKDNYRNDWDGTLPNGKPVENGIYYYVFTEGSSDDQRELKGAVEIRR